jgi:Na+(H+)/acetate symporter ActP
MISGEMEDVGYAGPEPSAAQGSPRDANFAGKIAPGTSKAIPIWLAVIVIVLGGLLAQTHTKVASYNFLIEGNQQMAGAAVMLDGQPRGVLQTSNEGGVTTTRLRLQLPDGTHEVAISKPGFQSAITTVTMRGEDYLSVELKPLELPK